VLKEESKANLSHFIFVYVLHNMVWSIITQVHFAKREFFDKFFAKRELREEKKLCPTITNRTWKRRIQE
jgi:hypothetical protein